MKKILPMTMLFAALGAHGQELDYAQLIPNVAAFKATNYSLAYNNLFDSSIPGVFEKGPNAFPVYSPKWQNGTFVSTLSGLGYNFSRDPRIQFGLRMTIEGARDEYLKRDDYLTPRVRNGNDASTLLESGAYLNYYINPNYALLSSIKYGTGLDRNGVFVSVGGQATTKFATNHRFTARFSANWANGSYLQSYFGVNSLQAGASNFGPFAPSSSLTDIKIGASWQWNIDTNWSLTTGASYKHLFGDANNSLNFQKSPMTIYSSASFRF